MGDIFCGIISVLCFYACCCMAPMIIRACTEGSNVQENQPEDEIEMEHLGRENNPNNTSYSIRNQLSHADFGIENML